MGLERPPVPTRRELRCSFYSRPGDEVAAIVCGPTTSIAICDRCVELCREIIAEQTTLGPAPPPAAA